MVNIVNHCSLKRLKVNFEEKRIGKNSSARFTARHEVDPLRD